MLIKLTKLEQTERFFEGGIYEIGVDPTLIDLIEPVDLQDYVGPACMITITGHEEPIAVAGDNAAVMKAINSAELTALDKLADIRAILESD